MLHVYQINALQHNTPFHTGSKTLSVTSTVHALEKKTCAIIPIKPGHVWVITMANHI